MGRVCGTYRLRKRCPFEDLGVDGKII